MWQLVSSDSASLDCVLNRLPLDRPHVLMNKFPGPCDPDYTKVVETIQRVLTDIQTGSLLAQADAWVLEKHYDKEKLEIVRLSGETLDMDHCYINLAILETRRAGVSKNIAKEETLQSSPFSLAKRLYVETPHKNLLVELPNLFQPRRLPNGNQMEPRRILIRGRAGVGKTTLCKKIVHDFVHKGMWRDLFKRLLWVQLRDLKDLPKNDNDLGGMLKHIFFQQHRNKKSLSDELRHHIEDPEAPDTLFLLDGLDEISEIVMEHNHRGSHQGHELLKKLFERSNLIVTTRPHAALPQGFETPDLELDTIGFSPDEVQSYLETVIPSSSGAIEAYLEKNPIMESLVRIPIHLDALCYTWQLRSKWNDSLEHMPETMTTVYEAMCTELWKKDNERLDGKTFPHIGNSCTSETEPFEPTEYNNLGYLAFSGLYSNVVEFQPDYRKALYRRMKRGETKFTFDETFARLSFLRTSDPSKAPGSRGFHFIHLTFQEYFSAKHFVKAWKDTQRLEYIKLSDGTPERGEISCHDFLQRHKYAARYNIMWRFVAGLLDAEGESQIASFFEAVESEPVDLFGPTHQRLVMHYLAEVLQSADIRTRLEEQLSKWLQFECKFRGRSNFIRETELPDRALNLVLEQTSEEVKSTVLMSLRQRPILPVKTIELVTPWLEGQSVSENLRLDTFWMLENRRECLPNRTLNAMVKWMGDEDSVMREAAVIAFYSQATWPEDILEAGLARLETQDLSTKLEAADALWRPSKLPENVVRKMTSWLEDGSTREAALAALEKQATFPIETIRTMGAQLGIRENMFGMTVFDVLKEQPGLPSDILDHMAACFEDQDGLIEDEDDLSEAEYDLMEDEFGFKRYESPRRLSDDLFLAVIRRIKDQYSNIQPKAMRVIQRQLRYHTRKDFPDDVLQVIASWLGAQDTATRHMALEVLKFSQELPEYVLRAVVAQLEASDRELHRMVCSILRRQSVLPPDVFPVMMNWVRSQDKGVRKMAVESLRGGGILPEGVPGAIVAQFEDQDRAIRLAALEVFAWRPREQDFPDDILRAVEAQLDDGDRAVRKAALEALGNFGRRQVLPDDVLDTVLARLKSQDEDIRKAALGTFEMLGSHQSIQHHIVQAIAAKLDEQNENIRRAALRALRELGSRQTLPRDVVEAVAAQLDDQNLGCRLSALTALASQTALSEDILSAVTAQLKDEHDAVRLAAIGALRSQIILPERVLEAMLACSDNPHVNVRRLVMEILKKQLGLCESFLAAVIPWIDDEDKAVRQGAVNLLGTNPTLPYKVLRALTTRLSDEFVAVRRAVLDALAGQRALPGTILTSPDLYPTFLAQSFDGPLCCYVEDGASYLELSAGLGKVRLEGQPDEFRAAMRERQRELGVPVRADRHHEEGRV